MINQKKMEYMSSNRDELRDADLTPEAQALADRLVLSTITVQEHRLIANFLNDKNYDVEFREMNVLPFNLMMECLPNFVHAHGGQIVFSMRINHNGEINRPKKKNLKINGIQRHILYGGMMFLYFPEKPVVVEVDDDPSQDKAIRVMACDGAGVFFDQWVTFSRRNNYLFGRAFFANGDLIERKRRYGWTDIVLPEETRQAIQTHVGDFLAHREQLKRLGAKPRRGIILSGPPGTGKTLIGKILADTLGVSFLWVTPRHIDSVRSFADLLSLARFIAPTVIFLEDLDLFAEERDRGGWMGLGELMNQLDGAVDNEDIVTIATTNRLDVIEKALRNRPGRFDRVLTIDVMDKVCRGQMVAKLLKPAQISAEDTGYLVCATDGYTGAQIEELINTLFIWAVNANNQNTQPDKNGQVSVDRKLINFALNEVQVDVKTRLGFHAA